MERETVMNAIDLAVEVVSSAELLKICGDAAPL
jgi:hypothetical protein